MDRKVRRQWWSVVAALVCGGTFLTAARGGDAGELFPNIAPYDQTVSSPISKPEREVPTRPPAPTTPAPSPDPVKPVTSPTGTPPSVDPKEAPPEPTVDPVAPPKRRPRRPGEGPQPTTTTAPAPPPILIDVAPFSAGLLTPILSVPEQETFNEQYGNALSKALAGSVELRKKTAEEFETAAETAPSPEFKRYLLLEAFAMYIRASTPIVERSQKAETLLQLLTERTLPVVQARADALNDLMTLSSSNPSERFLDMYMESHATLAKLQVQAGFPRDAQESLKKVREASLHLLHKSPTRQDQVNEAAAWCDRSTAAAALWPKFQATLKASPDDAFTNTMMATLHLSLYGNLASAAVFAARSDRKDLKAFAEVIKNNPPQALSMDQAQHTVQVLAIAGALIDVAKATNASQTFDRYSIACYAGDHVDQMLAANVVPADKVTQAKALLTAAKEIIDKTNLRRGDDLPRWLESATTVKGKTGEAASRIVGSLADVFHGLPRELAPTDLGWTDKQVNATNQWLEKNLVGQTFQADAMTDEMRSPVEGDDGKIYVPGLFRLPTAALNDNVKMATRIELRMSVKVAEKARNLLRDQVTTIRGTIISAHVIYFSGGRTFLQLVIVNKAD